LRQTATVAAVLTARRLAALLVVMAIGGPAAAAQAAGEPIMPLGDVHAGMRCEGASVVQGTTISSFDVEVVDIVAGDAAARQPYILFRASGPAIDRTGIGPGFSGSPIRCPAADGTLRIAGAISEGIGEYGGKTALATPIEAVLGEPVDVPAGTRSRPALLARARPIAEPVSFGGLSPRVAEAVRAAGRRAGRVVYAAPAAPGPATFPVQTLVPGAAMSAGLSSGDVTAAAVGTVTYVDGDRLWAFGHPLDAAGRRSLFLQDAYVYAVIANPIGSQESSTYKLAAPGHDVGTLTSDGLNAVAGRLGTLPPRFGLRVIALDADRHRQHVADVQIADESGVGLPTGTSALTQVGAVALIEVASTALQGVPSRQSAEMCARIDLREAPGKPLRFCNTYVGGGSGLEGLAGGPLVADFIAMTSQLDAYRFGPLHPAHAEVDLTLRRTLRQAFLFGARGPAVARRGHVIRVRVLLRRVDGPALTRTLRLRVPRATPRGTRVLTLTGTSADASAGGDGALTTTLDLGTLDAGPSPADEAGPRTVAALRAAVARIHRYDGVTAAFLRPGDATVNGDGTPKGRPVYRDGKLRLSGQATLRLRVR
jgi:hypothetical protein